jgi:hypothetical protein
MNIPKLVTFILVAFRSLLMKIKNESGFPSGRMKERRAGCFALGGRSETCPDL